MKELNDVIHLYLGCEIFKSGTKLISVNIEDEEYTILEDGYNSRVLSFTNTIPKPILRPLPDLKHEDYLELYEILNKEYNAYGNQSEQYKRNYAVLNLTGPDYKSTVFVWLLSKHFDLFGLINNGLAIDKTAITNQK